VPLWVTGTRGEETGCCSCVLFINLAAGEGARLTWLPKDRENGKMSVK